MGSEKPFGGAISRFYQKDAPKKLREAVAGVGKGEVIDPAYPYRREIGGKEYESALEALQTEAVKFQTWVKATGTRVVMLFEGRDAAGKGGCIRRFTEYLNPRSAHVVALAKPSDVERGQWYFQRYIAHLPAAGDLVFFDRSWYNRGVVEPVFDFCTDAQRKSFFAQVPEFERMLVEDGIHLFKFWLTVGRAEQLRRFLEREADPLKQWKLSSIDVDGLGKWDAYSEAIGEMFGNSHFAATPWTVVLSDDQKRARLEVMRVVLSGFDYAGKDAAAVGVPDPRLTGGPDILGNGGQ